MSCKSNALLAASVASRPAVSPAGTELGLNFLGNSESPPQPLPFQAVLAQQSKPPDSQIDKLVDPKLAARTTVNSKEAMDTDPTSTKTAKSGKRKRAVGELLPQTKQNIILTANAGFAQLTPAKALTPSDSGNQDLSQLTSLATKSEQGLLAGTKSLQLDSTQISVPLTHDGSGHGSGQDASGSQSGTASSATESVTTLSGNTHNPGLLTYADANTRAAQSKQAHSLSEQPGDVPHTPPTNLAVNSAVEAVVNPIPATQAPAVISGSSTTPSLTVDERKQILDQVATAVIHGSAGIDSSGSSQVVLHLNPKDWGDVRLSIRTTPGLDGQSAGVSVVAQVASNGSAVGDALTSQTDTLRSALLNSGLRLDRLTVNVSDSNSSGLGQQSGHSPNQNANQYAWSHVGVASHNPLGTQNPGNISHSSSLSDHHSAGVTGGFAEASGFAGGQGRGNQSNFYNHETSIDDTANNDFSKVEPSQNTGLWDWRA